MSVTVTAQGDHLSPGGAAAAVSITDTAVPGVYRFHLNRINQAANDDIRVIIKQAIRNVGDGATAQVVLSKLLDDAPVDDTADDHTNYVTAALDAPYGLEVLLEQEGGVQAVYPWSLVRVG